MRLAYRKKPSQAPLCIIDIPAHRTRLPENTPEVRNGPSAYTPEMGGRPTGTPEARSTHFVNPRQERRRPSPNSYKMGRASANAREDDETNEYCCINEDLVELQTDFVDPRVSVARKQNDAYEMLTRPQNEYLTLTA